MSIKARLKIKDVTREERMQRARELKAQQARDFEKRLAEARVRFAEIADADEMFAEKHILVMAENLSVKNWEIPPHWTGLLNCNLCGPMPAPKDADGMTCVACPWCHSHPAVMSRFDEVAP